MMPKGKATLASSDAHTEALPADAQPHPMKQWAVLSPALNEVQTIEAERMYLTAGSLTFMSGNDIIFGFAPGAWTTVKLLPQRWLVPSKAA